MLYSEHKLIMMLLRCMGVLSIACVVGAVHICACIYCSLLHALTRDHEVKDPVSETTFSAETPGG